DWGRIRKDNHIAVAFDHMYSFIQVKPRMGNNGTMPPRCDTNCAPRCLVFFAEEIPPTVEHSRELPRHISQTDKCNFQFRLKLSNEVVHDSQPLAQEICIRTITDSEIFAHLEMLS